MLPVSVARSSGEYRHDDLRPETPHHLDHVAEYRIARPVREALGRSLGKAEIVRAREILVRTVDASRSEQLLRANHAERFAELVADQVLSPIAPCERQISSLGAMTAREPCDQLRVLVVRMRTDHEHARMHSGRGLRFRQRDDAAPLSIQEARHQHYTDRSCQCGNGSYGK